MERSGSNGAKREAIAVPVVRIGQQIRGKPMIVIKLIMSFRSFYCAGRAGLLDSIDASTWIENDATNHARQRSGTKGHLVVSGLDVNVVLAVVTRDWLPCAEGLL